ncbi:hypothetical protein ACP3TJ_01615 [Desulforudis sp. 1088]|uniref:hypothetical protein n=1 Tax=unclassified Candidatus Desulforudis TaxID=2635950 RepID=UPI003BE8CD31
MLLLVFLGACARPEAPKPPGEALDRPPVDGKAPAFRAVDLASGKEVAFPDDFLGRPLAISFFSPG